MRTSPVGILSDTGRASRAESATRRLPSAAVPWCLAAITAAWTVWLLWDSYFYVDDFMRFGEASRTGLHWAYLSDSVFGHFVPGWRLVYFVLERTSGIAYRPVVLLEVLLQVSIAIGFYRLLRTLFGPERWVPWLVGVYVFSPAMMETVFWFANALHVLPSMSALIWALDGFARWYRGGRVHHLAYSVSIGSLGLMFYEKPILILVLVPVLAVVMSLGDGPLAQGVGAAGRGLLRVAPIWVIYSVPQAAYFGYFFANHYYASNTKPRISSFLAVAWKAWSHGIGPALIGGPFRWKYGIPGLGIGEPSTLVVTAGLIAAAVAIALSFALNRRAWIGWAFVIIGFGSSFGIVSWGRLTALGSSIALDYRYTGDALPLVLIGIAIAFNPVPALLGAPLPRPTALARHRRPSFPYRSLVAVLCALVAVVGLASVVPYRADWSRAVPKAWVVNYVNSVRALERSQRRFAILDAQVPAEIALLGGYPENLISWQSHFLAPGLHFDDAALPLYWVEPDGRVAPGRIAPISSVPGNHLSGSNIEIELQGSVCIPAGTSVLEAPMPPLALGVYTLSINYSTSAQAQANVMINTKKGPVYGTLDPAGVQLRPSVHQALAPLVPTALESISLTMLAHARVCISSVAIGIPVGA